MTGLRSLALGLMMITSQGAWAGNCSTKTPTINMVLGRYFDKQKIDSIKKNHPHLTPFVARDILTLLESSPEWSHLSIDEIYAKFIIQASVRTGFRAK